MYTNMSQSLWSKEISSRRTVWSASRRTAYNYSWIVWSWPFKNTVFTLIIALVFNTTKFQLSKTHIQKKKKKRKPIKRKMRGGGNSLHSKSILPDHSKVKSSLSYIPSSGSILTNNKEYWTVKIQECVIWFPSITFHSENRKPQAYNCCYWF